jgi:hypothetical protein
MIFMINIHTREEKLNLYKVVTKDEIQIQDIKHDLTADMPQKSLSN